VPGPHSEPFNYSEALQVPIQVHSSVYIMGTIHFDFEARVVMLVKNGHEVVENSQTGRAQCKLEMKNEIICLIKLQPQFQKGWK